MLTLHHSRASVASAKVRLVLAEKALPFTGHVLDLHRGDQYSAEYRAIHPASVVPVLIHDGHVVVESTVIMHYLEEAFPTTTPLLPADPYSRALARAWMKKVDESLHPACVTLTFALAFRRALANKTPEEIDARFRALRDPVLRSRVRPAVLEGVNAPQMAEAISSFDALFRDMEAALRRSTFLVGDAYSLADAAIAPYAKRTQMLGIAGLWVERPNVAGWFERVRARPSFDEAVEGMLTDEDRRRLTVSPEESWPRLHEILSQVDPDER